MAKLTNVKYPIGIQSFEKIRTDGYIYIDKTELIYKLLGNGQFYFLSRPRRFGKSLLLSTIKAYFEGKKHLFDHLAIAAHETIWEKYPVITLSLATYDPNKGTIEDVLENQFAEFEDQYGLTRETSSLGQRFRNLILSAYKSTGRQVAILIDEYDAPLTAHLHDEKRREEITSLLKSVYVNLKDMDEYIKFGMVTGVTRFSKMSIFSGLNNLNDITLDPEYSEICGITQYELTHNFQPGIEKLADRLKVSPSEAIQLLKENYDGYHFTKDSVDIYNPFSLLSCLSKSDIGAYWFQNGTPTFLIKEILRDNKALPQVMNETATARTLTDIDTYRTSISSLLFQAGYLTIKDYDSRRKSYTLKVPNKEVEDGLFSQILSYIADVADNRINDVKWDIRIAFEDGEPAKGLESAKTFLAGIPPYLSQNKPEIYFENNLFLLFSLAGMEVNAEWWTSDGRIDMLLRTPDYIYVIELKLDKSAEEALRQIDTKDYTLQFQDDGRKIVKIGINFSSATRNIDSYIIA